MKVLDITEVKLEWSDINSRIQHPKPTHKRSPGVHVSGVLKHIAQKLGTLKEDDGNDEMPMVVAMGMAFEEWAAGLYPKMKWQPGELKHQGVVGSPDGKSWLTRLGQEVCDGLEHKPVIEEFKFTYKSLRTRQGDAILHEWLWMQQIMAYCNMDKNKPDLGRLHVWFAAGDYTYPLKPRYLRYLIQFSELELKNNWAMIQRYKALAPREG